MTMVDTDSESQDSDDGRRFRFEATRKDVFSSAKGDYRSPKKKSKHRSHSEDKEDKEDKEDDNAERKEKKRDKHESSKKESIHSRERDRSRHTNGSKGTSYEDGGSSQRNRRGSHSTSSERNVKHLVDTRDKSRDLKRRERDRSDHRKQSKERSHDRDYEERLSLEKHSSKYRDSHNHYSRHKNRDRSPHLRKLRLPEDSKFQNEHRKHDSDKKLTEKRMQRSSEERVESRNTNKSHDNNKSNGNEVCQMTAASLNEEENKDLELSDQDVSDISGSKSSSSSSHYHKAKTKEVLKDEMECLVKEQIDKEQMEELHKVNPENSILLSNADNNNPGAISDVLLGSTSPIATPLMTQEQMLTDEKNMKTDLVEPSKKGDDEIPLYGPKLPAKSLSQIDENHDKETNSPQYHNEEGSANNIEIKRFIGPRLPENYQNLREDKEESSDSADDAMFGPALPPHLMNRQELNNGLQSRLIGPVIPENVKLSSEGDHTAMYLEATGGKIICSSSSIGEQSAEEQLEKAGLHYLHEFKQETANTKYTNKREEWMTELPPARAADFGLCARKFRIRPGPDMSDRSCWTDTPSERNRKEQAKERESKIQLSKTKDVKELYEEESPVRQEKSLLEIHQSKLRKKKKKEEKEAKAARLPTRRPFDRNIDLQVNRYMDHSQKRSVLLKARFMNERFSRGQI